LTLLDLAPDGGCLAARLTADAGALLPHRFTLAGSWPLAAGCWQIAEWRSATHQMPATSH